MTAALPPDEEARLGALHRYGILDQPRTPDLESLTRLASFVAGTEVAAINLMDRDRQWQAAATGMEADEVPRRESMCAVTVAADERIDLVDARLDERFADNPFVTGVRGSVRLYVGTPLRDADGHMIGTLCVADSQPGKLSEDQLLALDELATQVMQLFELHRHTSHLSEVLAELDHLADHDPLTGLANRRRFTGALATRLDDPAAGPTTVLYGDLDGFKRVNDVLGHATGDEVLRVVADRLARATRPGDLLARLGGDEFAMLCVGLGAADAGPLLARLRSVVAEPIHWDGTEVVVGLSLGSAHAVDGFGLDQLLLEADRRMYQDKLTRR